MLEATLFLNSCSKVPWVWREVSMQASTKDAEKRKEVSMQAAEEAEEVDPV